MLKLVSFLFYATQQEKFKFPKGKIITYITSYNGDFIPSQFVQSLGRFLDSFAFCLCHLPYGSSLAVLPLQGSPLCPREKGFDAAFSNSRCPQPLNFRCLCNIMIHSNICFISLRNKVHLNTKSLYQVCNLLHLLLFCRIQIFIQTPSYVQNNTIYWINNLCGTSDAIALATKNKLKSMKMINTDKSLIDLSGSEKSPLTLIFRILRFPHFPLAFWLLYQWFLE